MTAQRWVILGLVVIAAAATVFLATGDGDDPAASDFEPVECMNRAAVEAELGEPVSSEPIEVGIVNPCGSDVGWDEGGQDGRATTAHYSWGSVDYVDGRAVGWVEGAEP